ncbi:unnamed protein product [Paramecium sonneborni]|uniref:Uncharacterized protein n=1 Tax=Paramecium sonneborni TaxID=65129 RepID=A0A8S1RMD2_9CILI|nr:unnamed protein product [Paramecium sonneborni]
MDLAIIMSQFQQALFQLQYILRKNTHSDIFNSSSKQFFLMNFPFPIKNKLTIQKKPSSQIKILPSSFKFYSIHSKIIPLHKQKITLIYSCLEQILIFHYLTLIHPLHQVLFNFIPIIKSLNKYNKNKALTKKSKNKPSKKTKNTSNKQTINKDQ